MRRSLRICSIVGGCSGRPGERSPQTGRKTGWRAAIGGGLLALKKSPSASVQARCKRDYGCDRSASKSLWRPMQHPARVRTCPLGPTKRRGRSMNQLITSDVHVLAHGRASRKICSSPPHSSTPQLLTVGRALWLFGGRSEWLRGLLRDRWTDPASLDALEYLPGRIGSTITSAPSRTEHLNG